MIKDYQLVETIKGSKYVTPLSLKEAKEILADKFSEGDWEVGEMECEYEKKLDWLEKFNKVEVGNITIFKCRK